MFAEIVWILQGSRYEFPRDRIATSIKMIINLPQIICTKDRTRQALYYYTSHPTVSYVDAYLVTCANLNDAKPLLTFDKEIKAALPEHTFLLIVDQQ